MNSYQATQGLNMYNSTLHNDSVKFLVGVNTSYKGKTGKERVSGAGFWQEAEKTAQELADHIAKGYGWMPALIDKGQKRWQVNCNTAYVLAADIDNEMTLEQAKEHPFIKQYAILIIESSSSTSEHNKFRVVFRYQQPIKGWENIRALNTYLIHEVLGVADKSCKDASRFFFGAENRPIILINEEARIPQSFIDEAFAHRKKEEAIAAERQAKAEAFSKLIRETVSITDLRSIAVQALSYTPIRIIKGDTYEPVFRCLASLVWEFGENDAVSMMESHSPSFRDKKGEWNVAKTARSIARGSSSGKQCRIGTLFDYAVKGGWEFPPELKKLQQEYVLAHGGGLGWQKPKPGEYLKKVVQKVKDRLTPEETKVAKKIISVVPSSTPVNPLEAEAHQSQFKQWKRFVTGYTSNHDICSKYLNLGLIKDQIDAFTWGIFIRSPLGSGKTWLLKPGDGTDGLIDYLGELAGINPEEQARIGGGLLGYRNTLSIQIGKAIDAIQIGNANEQQKKLVDAWLAGCIDSLEKVPVGFFKGKLLILDELTSVIDHMIIGSTCHDKRDYVFERFTEAVKDARFVVCLDANMADWAVDFITTIRNPSKDEKCLKVNNVATPKDTQVEVIATFSQKEITQKILELAPYYHAKDQAIAIASDSQAFLEKIDGLLAKQGFDFFRLDSKTTHKKECMDFIEDPESIETPMRLGFSPVCDTGLNVSSPKYVHTFGYFCGVLGTASQIQMLRRPRASTKITVSCVPYTRINAVQSSRKSEFVEEQKQALFKGLEGMPKELLDQVKAHWGQSEVGIQFKTLWDLKHYRNYERKNTLECLVEMLKTHGYSPTVVEAGAVTGQQKEELLEYRRQEAIALIEARQITDDEAQSIASKATLWTTQERREYRAWEIKNAFPDWADNWNPEWIFEKDNELINSFDYKAQLKEVGTAIQIKEATGIYNAVDITARQAESLRTKIGLTPQEWCQLERYKIKQDLLTIETYNGGEFWNVDAIIEIRKRIYGLSAYRIKWCYENLEKAKAIRQLKWVNDLDESRFIGDCLQNYYGKAKLLQELNLSELPKEFSADTPLVKKLSGEIARSKRERLRGTLGAVKGQMENIPWIKRLLGVMGEKVVCTGRSHGESRTYTIAEFDALDKAIFACISKTLEIQYQTTLEPCHQSRKEEEKSNKVVQDQADNTQNTQPPAPAPLEVVAGSVKMDKINKYDRFLYRGYEVVYLKSFAGDMDFYVVMLNKVISLCDTSELVKINGIVDSGLRNFLESEVA